LAEYAMTLCDAEGLKDAYLNTEFDKIKKLFTNLEKMDKQESKWMPSSKTESSSSPESVVEEPVDPLETDNVPKTVEELEALEREQVEKGRGREKIKDNKVRIKILISEIAKSSKEKGIRRALAPVMSGLNIGPTFGMFHSGLIVGPWLIEWNNSSLCIPRRCYSSAAVLAVDVDHVIHIDLDRAVEACAKVICEWNINRQYGQTTNNCQNFVDALLEAIGIKVQFQEPLNHYLEKMRKKGHAKVKWAVPTDIRELCDIKEAKIEFKTHSQLDRTVRDIQEKIPLFHEQYEVDWQFLKAFDRAFWLRHFKDNLDGTYQPLTKEGAEVESTEGHIFCGDCPFGHPEDRSFTQDWW